MLRKSLFLLCCLIPLHIAIGQNPSDPKKAEETDKLKNQAVEFLRETQAEVSNMRSIENRISFGAEMASLMWLYDEKEAVAMYQAVGQDFRQLLFGFDSQMNSFAAASDDDDYVPGGMFIELSDKAKIERKFRTALSLRQQIALSLAEHEPDLALAFYYDSVAVLTNRTLIERTKDGGASFEFQLMTQVASTNAVRATQFGVKSLDHGVNYQHIELLKKIYEKDPDKGIEFASAIVSKLKADKVDSSEVWIFSSLIKYGEEIALKVKNESGKKPVLTSQNMRDLAEAMAQLILSADSLDYMDGGYTELIEKYSPGRAAQLRAKFRKKSDSSAASITDKTGAGYSAGLSKGSGVGIDESDDPNSPAALRLKAVKDRDDASKKLFEDVQSLGTKSLSKEEREKIVTQSRQIISKTRGTDNKIGALSLLAAQVAKAGDKELAGEIMRDAESLVNPYPKNYQDYLLRWLLASGYAEIDPDESFSILNDTIYRLNDTIRAFITAAEFIDVQGEMISDGEVQVGQFGGSMIRGLTKDAGIAVPTIRRLAKADFAKTKAIANSFERPEVRVLAKMMVLRAIVDQDNAAKSGKDPDGNLVEQAIAAPMAPMPLSPPN